MFELNILSVYSYFSIKLNSIHKYTFIPKYSKRTKVFARHKSQVYHLCHLLTKCLVGFQEGD